MTEITSLLRASGGGDRNAADRLFALLYADLHRLAHSRLRKADDMTLLDTTALVHESYLRFKGVGELDFPDRQHFLAYASRVMRTVVVDLIRSRQAERRGGQAVQVTFDTSVADGTARHEEEVLRVHEALDELSATDTRLASVVELRYFGGLSELEIAASLGLTERTVQRDWKKARALLWTALR